MTKGEWKQSREAKLSSFRLRMQFRSLLRQISEDHYVPDSIGRKAAEVIEHQPVTESVTDEPQE